MELVDGLSGLKRGASWLRVAFDIMLKRRCSYLKPSLQVPRDNVKAEDWSPIGMARVLILAPWPKGAKEAFFGERNSRG